MFLSIIAGFTPFASWSNEDFYKNEYGIEKINISYNSGISYFFHYILLKDLDEGSEFNRYTFFSFFIYDEGNKDLLQEVTPLTDYDLENPSFINLNFFNILGFIASVFGLMIVFYFTNQFLKYLGKKKTKMYLLLSIAGIFMILLFYLSAFYSHLFLFSSNKISGFSINLGTYIAIFASILYLILYFLQNKLLEQKTMPKNSPREL